MSAWEPYFEVVKNRAQAIVDAIAIDKKSAEEKLEAAKPAMEAAEKALETITPSDITTVKKLGKPPHLIMRIMDCVLILMGKKLDPVKVDEEKGGVKPSWGSAVRLMNDNNFLKYLLEFNKDTITDEMIDLLQLRLKRSNLLTNNSESFPFKISSEIKSQFFSTHFPNLPKFTSG